MVEGFFGHGRCPPSQLCSWQLAPRWVCGHPPSRSIACSWHSTPGIFVPSGDCGPCGPPMIWCDPMWSEQMWATFMLFLHVPSWCGHQIEDDWCSISQNQLKISSSYLPVDSACAPRPSSSNLCAMHPSTSSATSATTMDESTCPGVQVIFFWLKEHPHSEHLYQNHSTICLDSLSGWKMLEAPSACSIIFLPKSSKFSNLLSLKCLSHADLLPISAQKSPKIPHHSTASTAKSTMCSMASSESAADLLVASSMSDLEGAKKCEGLGTWKP